MKRNPLTSLFWGIALLCLLCLPSTSKDDAILKGIDIWVTPGDGLTFSNFELEPIPADFFCKGSQPFTGKIEYQGVPIATSPESALNDADTVIERLDDASFGNDGRAFTRVRFAALQMEGIEPVQTDCGLFHVTMALAGEQPVTTMRITRLDKSGGLMDSVLAGEVALTFTPLDRDDLEPRILRQSFRFSPSRGSWEERPAARFRKADRIALDSDGDGEVDRVVPGLSNFAAGAERSSSSLYRDFLNGPSIGSDPGFDGGGGGGGGGGDPSPSPTPSPSPSPSPSPTPSPSPSPPIFTQCHCTLTAGFQGEFGRPSSPEISIAPGVDCLHLHCPVRP